jgi:hypothetical protein
VLIQSEANNTRSISVFSDQDAAADLNSVPSRVFSSLSDANGKRFADQWVAFFHSEEINGEHFCKSWFNDDKTRWINFRIDLTAGEFRCEAFSGVSNARLLACDSTQGIVNIRRGMPINGQVYRAYQPGDVEVGDLPAPALPRVTPGMLARHTPPALPRKPPSPEQIAKYSNN